MRELLCLFVLVVMACALPDCGGGEIDASEVNPGSVLNARPFTLKQGAEPVTGIVAGSMAAASTWAAPSDTRRWTKLAKGDETVLAAEGTTAEGGGWVGSHKTYHLNGKLRDLENWEDGALHGPYKRWADSGEIEEEGSYAKGQKVGTWTLVSCGNTVVTEYDASKFMDPKYALPFMAAIGLQPGPQWPLATDCRTGWCD